MKMEEKIARRLLDYWLSNNESYDEEIKQVKELKQVAAQKVIEKYDMCQIVDRLKEEKYGVHKEELTRLAKKFPGFESAEEFGKGYHECREAKREFEKRSAAFIDKIEDGYFLDDLVEELKAQKSELVELKRIKDQPKFQFEVKEFRRDREDKYGSARDRYFELMSEETPENLERLLVGDYLFDEKIIANGNDTFGVICNSCCSDDCTREKEQLSILGLKGYMVPGQPRLSEIPYETKLKAIENSLDEEGRQKLKGLKQTAYEKITED